MAGGPRQNAYVIEYMPLFVDAPCWRPCGRFTLTVTIVPIIVPNEEQA